MKKNQQTVQQSASSLSRKHFFKWIKRIFLLTTLLVFIFLFNCTVRFPVRIEGISLTNITSSEQIISFDVYQMDSGYYLSDFTYTIEDNQLILQFWGTLFSKLSGHIPSNRITISTNTPIHSIILQSKQQTHCVWTDETTDSLNEFNASPISKP